MKQEAFPNISFDYVTVSTFYMGATPQEVEKLITIPLEEELEQVDDIKEITSTSIENLSTIMIQIDPDADNKDKVVQDIQTAVDRVKDLPSDIEDDPIVIERETKNMPVIQVSLTGLPYPELRDHAEALKERLQDIPGVAKIEKSGWLEREMHVDVDPLKIHNIYLSLNEIIEALRAKNVNLPGGDLQTNTEEFLVRTMGEFNDKEGIENVIIRANEGGNWIRVSDIATVKDTFEDQDVMFKTEGTRSINLIVVKRESGDTLKVVNRVNEIIEEFQLSAADTLSINTFDDISYYIKRRLKVLVNNGILGIIFVTLSLLFFLRTRIALLTAIGLPVAFCTTLILMSLFGISINLISMFGMIIVLGMLVDDGIIIAENCYRHIENGMLPHDAAIKGTNEVTTPVIATIATTFAFFTPLFFMSGMMGKYTRNIPQVVILMLFASLIEALFIMPSHIADFAGKYKETKKRPGDIFFRWLLGYYRTILKLSVKFRYLTMVIVFLIAGFAIFLQMNFMSFQLFSKEGMEEFYIKVEAPIGYSIEQTETLLGPLEKTIAELPDDELETFTTTIGQVSDKDTSEKGSHLAQIYVYLTPEAYRKRKTPEIVATLRAADLPIPEGAKITFEEIRPGPPVGKSVEVKLRGDDFDHLLAVAARVQPMLEGIEGVRDIKNDYTLGKKELRIIVNEEKAASVFLSVQDIAHTIRYAFDGGVATTIKTTDEEIDVLVRFPEQIRDAMSVFDKILVPNKYGKLIPLNKVATIETAQGISSIFHLDRKRVVTVSANVQERIITSREVNALIAKQSAAFTKDYLDVSLYLKGEEEDANESMGSLAFAFIWGFMIVFLILASTFGSLVQPLIVLTSIPLGLVGVIYAFFLHGKPLGFLAVMGTVGLAGVAVNDAIVLVDFINKRRKEGNPRRDSIIDGCILRLRPVILTTITTVLGLAPVAYGWGGSDPFLIPMALAMAWGLVFATSSTLIVIPCVYAIIDDISHIGPRILNKVLKLHKETAQ